MTRKLAIAFAIVALLALALGTVGAQEKAAADKAKAAAKKEVKHDYIGAKRCKICHTKDNTYPTWEQTLHAQAFAKLPEAQQKNEKCLACHATGVTAKGVVLEGVQCEACHGPGNDYKTKKIMQNRELAIENGLLIPNEATCCNCHRGELPEECGEHAKFEYAKMLDKGVHARKEKKK